MRGGYRPGAGRKPGSKDSSPRKVKAKKSKPEQAEKARPKDKNEEKLKNILTAGKLAKAKMLGTFINRIAAGEQLSTSEQKIMLKLEQEIESHVSDSEHPKDHPPNPEQQEDLLPLQYMLKIMNNPQVDSDRRDKMAIAAAPFLHQRAGDAKTKKQDQEERAKRASSGRFAPSRPPTLKAIK